MGDVDVRAVCQLLGVGEIHSVVASQYLYKIIENDSKYSVISLPQFAHMPAN